MNTEQKTGYSDSEQSEKTGDFRMAEAVFDRIAGYRAMMAMEERRKTTAPRPHLNKETGKTRFTVAFNKPLVMKDVMIAGAEKKRYCDNFAVNPEQRGLERETADINVFIAVM